MVRGAVVLMQYRSGGGTGRFQSVAACVPNNAGEYIGTYTTLIGDRVLPESVRLENGKIVVEYLDRRVGDPMSAIPIVKKIKVFVVAGGELIEQQ